MCHFTWLDKGKPSLVGVVALEEITTGHYYQRTTLAHLSLLCCSIRGDVPLILYHVDTMRSLSLALQLQQALLFAHAPVILFYFLPMRASAIAAETSALCLFTMHMSLLPSRFTVKWALFSTAQQQTDPLLRPRSGSEPHALTAFLVPGIFQRRGGSTT